MINYFWLMKYARIVVLRQLFVHISSSRAVYCSYKGKQESDISCKNLKSLASHAGWKILIT